MLMLWNSPTPMVRRRHAVVPSSSAMADVMPAAVSALLTAVITDDGGRPDDVGSEKSTVTFGP